MKLSILSLFVLTAAGCAAEPAPRDLAPGHPARSDAGSPQGGPPANPFEVSETHSLPVGGADGAHGPAHAGHQPRTEAPSGNTGGEGMVLYTCPMHPEVVRAEPGDCPECGMRLRPIAAPAEGGPR